ncbi:type IV pilus assembly protein FimV [Propionivibrio limicola]|uniref:type IV pilus assembly protein FimV n=1 Tax=Propionivibrio limicola TaxID=167645 RepID=UPI0012915349|nr:hypothetical protein [Propionivibrio limicola]
MLPRFRLLPLRLLLTGTALQLMAAATLAGGLGELTVRSHLGHRFVGEIQLIERPGDVNPAETCFRLDRADEGSSDIPHLTRGRISIERQNGRSKLLIFSDQIINDPVILIRLRAGCGTELVRNYTALIDPGPVASPAAQRPTPPETQPNRASNTPTAQTAESESPPPVAKPRPARPPRAQTQSNMASRIADRLITSEGEGAGDQPLPLRLSTEITSRALARKVSENQRAMLRAEYRLLDSLHARAIAQLAITERLRALDAQVENLLTANESAAQELKESAAQAPSAPPSPTSPPSTTDAPNAQPNGSAPSPGSMAVGQATSSSTAEPLPYVFWLGAALAGTLAAALALYHRQVSRRRSEAPPAPTEAPPSSVAESMTTFPQARFFETIEPAFQPNQPMRLTPAATQSGIPAGGAAAQKETLAPVSSRHLDIEVGGEDESDHRTTLELAEIMMAFGKSEEATQTLEDYLAHHPGAAPEPWFKLLEMYWMDGLREKFESSLAEFRTHFNAAPLPWEEAADFFKELPPATAAGELSIDERLQRLQIADTFPAIADEIRRRWGTQDALAYLRTLLREPDPMVPQGFTLPLMRELLLLKDALKSQLAARAAPAS